MEAREVDELEKTKTGTSVGAGTESAGQFRPPAERGFSQGKATLDGKAGLSLEHGSVGIWEHTDEGGGDHTAVFLLCCYLFLSELLALFLPLFRIDAKKRPKGDRETLRGNATRNRSSNLVSEQTHRVNVIRGGCQSKRFVVSWSIVYSKINRLYPQKKTRHSHVRFRRALGFDPNLCSPPGIPLVNLVGSTFLPEGTPPGGTIMNAKIGGIEVSIPLPAEAFCDWERPLSPVSDKVTDPPLPPDHPILSLRPSTVGGGRSKDIVDEGDRRNPNERVAVPSGGGSRGVGDSNPQRSASKSGNTASATHAGRDHRVDQGSISRPKDGSCDEGAVSTNVDRGYLQVRSM